jgi:hypothetical protein
MQHKFTKKQISEQQAELRQQTDSEFGSAEDMLRFDAGQVIPPPSIARRLQESLAKEETKPWWRRWFSSDEDL